MPLIERLDAKAKQAVIISNDDFVVLQVGGEGMEAGQRGDWILALRLLHLQECKSIGIVLDVHSADTRACHLLHHKLLQ